MQMHKSTLCVDLRWIDKSGVGVYIKGILPGIVKELANTTIIGIGNRDRLTEFAWARSSNVQLVDCRAKPYSVAEQFQLPAAIPRQTDLLFSPYYTIPLLYRGRLAVTVHDMSHLVVEEIVGDRRKRLYAQVMYRELRRRAALIFTVSQFSKAELLRFTSGTREDNIIPIHLGVSPEWYGASNLPRLREPPYFIYVGNIKPYKNLPRLVEAFLSVRERLPHHLVLVGQSEGMITGETPEFLQSLKKSSDRIHLTGIVSYQELLSLVGRADALMMPSLYEGFGLPPLEAMAAGVPTAVARAGSLPEVCGDAAFYFDPLRIEEIAESMVQLAENRDLRSQLQAKGLQRSRMFRWDECSRRTAAELRSLLE